MYNLTYSFRSNSLISTKISTQTKSNIVEILKKKASVQSIIDCFNFSATPTNLNLIKISTWVLILFFLFHFTTLQISCAMRIHPVASKRSLSIRDGFCSSMEGNSSKKLRRLPHVFSNVLELPFRSDADVEVEDSPENIRFIAKIDVDHGGGDADALRAHAVEIHPGVTKIVVRNRGGDAELLLDQLKMDAWRFRLPPSTQPKLATAVFVDGELTVTVPKRGGQIDIDGGIWRAPSNLVLVQ